MATERKSGRGTPKFAADRSNLAQTEAEQKYIDAKARQDLTGMGEALLLHQNDQKKKYTHVVDVSDETVAQVAEIVGISGVSRRSFAQAVNITVRVTVQDWERRNEESRRNSSEIYAGSFVKALRKVEHAAKTLSDLLDPFPLPDRGRNKEDDAAVAFLFMSYPKLDDLREGIMKLELQAAALAIRELGGVDERNGKLLPTTFRERGRPRGTTGRPLFDHFVDRIRIHVRQHGGGELTAYDRDMVDKQTGGGERETCGTLEPVIEAFRPYLPKGFYPPKWAANLRKRLNKK
jgi:DNA-binding transcriptional regulator YiaG